VIVNTKVIIGTVNNKKRYLGERYLSLPVNRRTKIK